MCFVLCVIHPFIEYISVYHWTLQHPDESNFKQLEEMYGNVDGTSVKPSKDKLRSRRTSTTPNEEQILQEKFELYSSFLSDPIQVSNSNDAKDGWRLLRKTNTIEHHEKDLGNGYKIRADILLA